ASPARNDLDDIIAQVVVLVVVKRPDVVFSLFVVGDRDPELPAGELGAVVIVEEDVNLGVGGSPQVVVARRSRDRPRHGVDVEEQLVPVVRPRIRNSGRRQAGDFVAFTKAERKRTGHARHGFPLSSLTPPPPSRTPPNGRPRGASARSAWLARRVTS